MRWPAPVAARRARARGARAETRRRAVEQERALGADGRLADDRRGAAAALQRQPTARSARSSAGSPSCSPPTSRARRSSPSWSARACRRCSTSSKLQRRARRTRRRNVRAGRLAARRPRRAGLDPPARRRSCASTPPSSTCRRREVSGAAQGADQLDAAVRRSRSSIALDLFRELGVTLTVAERNAIEQRPTRSLAAFLAYSRGLVAEDEGRYDDASRFYRDAVRLDPGLRRGAAEEREGAGVSAGAAVTRATIEAGLQGTPKARSWPRRRGQRGAPVAGGTPSGASDLNPSPAGAATAPGRSGEHGPPQKDPASAATEHRQARRDRPRHDHDHAAQDSHDRSHDCVPARPARSRSRVVAASDRARAVACSTPSCGSRRSSCSTRCTRRPTRRSPSSRSRCSSPFPLGSRFTFDVGTAYARARVTSGAARERDQRAHRHAVRGNLTLGSDFVVLTAGVNLPTGKSSVDARPARGGGSDRQRLPRLPDLEHGHRARADRRRRGRAADRRVERRLRRRGAALDGVRAVRRARRDACAIQPGDEYRARARRRPRRGRRAQLALGVTYSAFGDDDAAARRTTPATASSRRARSPGRRANDCTSRRTTSSARRAATRRATARAARTSPNVFVVDRPSRAGHASWSRASSCGTGCRAFRRVAATAERRSRAARQPVGLRRGSSLRRASRVPERRALPERPARHDRRVGRQPAQLTGFRAHGGDAGERGSITLLYASSRTRACDDVHAR